MVKRLFITVTVFFVCIISSYANSQSKESTENAGYYYMEIYWTGLQVAVFYGTHYAKLSNKAFGLADMDNGISEFKAMILALNYLGAQGWECIAVRPEFSDKAVTSRAYYLLRRSRSLPSTYHTKYIEEELSKLK